MKKLLSVILSIIMLLSVCPLDLSASAATEASGLPTGYAVYSEGVTQYFKYNNYLYKVVWGNYKFHATNGTTSVKLLIYGGNLAVEANYLAVYGRLNKVIGGLSSTRYVVNDLPKTVNGSINCFDEMPSRHIDQSKPMAVITCIGVNAPTWTWADDKTTATAVFVSTDGKAQATVSANVTSSTEPAKNCQQKDKITYTASVTFNGTAYSDTKTADGATGNHVYDKTVEADDYLKTAATCTAPSVYYKSCVCGAVDKSDTAATFDDATPLGHSCVYTSASEDKIEAVCEKCDYSSSATIYLTDDSAIYTGNEIKLADVQYDDNWSDDEFEITYKNNIAVGTATATIFAGDAKASVSFDITADYTAADKALADLEAALGDDTLTDEAKALYDEYKQTLESYKADKTTVQETVNTLTANINALKDNIVNDTAVLPVYTAIDEAYAKIVVPADETLTDEAQAKLNAIDEAVAEAKKSATQAELNVVEAGILADIKALTDAITDTSALKADYTEVDEAFAALVAPEGEELTEEAVKAIEDIKAAVDAFKAEDTSKTELAEALVEINADIKAVADAIADTSYLKADYTEVDEAIAALTAPEGDELTDEAVAVIADIKAVVDALKAEDTSKTELAEALVEINADIKAVEDAIVDTSYLKANTTVADGIIAAIDETLAEGKFDDEEAIARIEEIKAEIEAIKADGNTSMAEYQEKINSLLPELESLYEYCQECEHCGNIHTTKIHEYICIIVMLIKLVASFIGYVR